MQPCTCAAGSPDMESFQEDMFRRNYHNIPCSADVLYSRMLRTEQVADRCMGNADFWCCRIFSYEI